MTPRHRALTAEEKYRRSVRARLRFKALVRLAMANMPWLEDDEDEQLGDNIEKNIRILTRKKELSSIFTLAEKAILNKPKEWRTEEDMNFLNRKIVGLRCFRRYPAEVKTRLSGVMHYLYVGPGRTLLRQDQDPVNAYVILSGDVGVTQTYFDRLLNEMTTVELPGMGANSLLGEVSLLNGIKRTATVTTLTPCEFLYLSKEDFDVVLKQTVAKRWQEVQDNMARFTYFDDWNDLDVRESCIMSRRRDFQPEEVVLSEGVGLQDMVHFVTKGRCYLIEVIFVKEFFRNGLKHYELAKPDEIPLEISRTISKVRSLADLKKLLSGLGDKFGGASSPKKQRSLSKSPASSSHKIEDSPRSGSTKDSAGKKEARRSILVSSSRVHTMKKSISFMDDRVDKSRKSLARELSSLEERKVLYRRKSQLSEEKSKLVKPHFTKICTFSELACFNIGENRKNRVFVADLYTECFLLPRFLLLGKSRNVFHRVEMFLEKMVPSTEKLFENFLADVRWRRYKKKMIGDLLAGHKNGARNSVHNVPYSIRLEDDLKFSGAVFSANFK